MRADTYVRGEGEGVGAGVETTTGKRVETEAAEESKERVVGAGGTGLRGDTKGEERGT